MNLKIPEKQNGTQPNFPQKENPFKMQSGYLSNDYIRLLPILGLSLVLQILFINFFEGMKLSGDQAHYFSLINDFYRGKGIATIYRPPGIVWFGALVFKIFGPSLKYIFYIQAIINIVCVVIFDRIAKQLSYGIWNRNYISVVYAIYPTFVLYSGLLLTEVLFMLFFLSFIFFWLKAIDTEQFVYAILAGILLGCSSLVRPVAYLILPFVFVLTCLYEITFHKFRLKKAFLFLFAFFAMLVVISPWTYRNYKLCLKFVLVSSSSGEMFWSGNNMFSEGFYTPDSGLEGTNVNLNNYSVEERRNPCFRIEFDRIAKEEAYDFIKSNPKRFMILTLKKLSNVFNPKRDYIFPLYCSDKVGPLVANFVPTLANMVIYMLGIAGLILTFDLHSRNGFFLLAIVCYFVAVITFTIFSARYMIPIIPFIILSSSNASKNICLLKKRLLEGTLLLRDKMIVFAWVIFLVNMAISNWIFIKQVL